MKLRSVPEKILKSFARTGGGDESPASGLPRPGQRTSSVHPALGSRGQASFIVSPGTRGLSVRQKFRKHSIRASHTAEVVLDDVRVPGRCLVGGNGYSREYPVEWWHRDAKIFTIFEGTSEIQRMLIGRAVTGLDVR